MRLRKDYLYCIGLVQGVELAVSVRVLGDDQDQHSLIRVL